MIETLPNKFAGREYEVELADPEFTSICPLTGTPDFGTLTIRYVPGEKLLELRSLRDYLAGFRSREILQEEVVNEVLDEIVASAAPARAEVEGVFNTRGGMATRVVARTSRVPGAPLAVRGRRGQYFNTDSESTVPPAESGGSGGRLRRPGGAAGQGREE